MPSIVIGALTVDGLAGSYTPFDARIHEASRSPHQIEVARRFRLLLTDSEIRRDHENCDRVQDPYAVRCMPQVLGAVEGALAHGARRAGSGAQRRHRQSADLRPRHSVGRQLPRRAARAAQRLSRDRGRRDRQHVGAAHRSARPPRQSGAEHVPDHRARPRVGLHDRARRCRGADIGEPHAGASASVDNVTTSAGQEDHVSMAPWAGFKLRRICDNTAQRARDRSCSPPRTRSTSCNRSQTTEPLQAGARARPSSA